jgi:sugar phosphate isomerase/epimerase
VELYLSTWSVHTLLFEEAITIREMPALARALGFQGVELEDIFFESMTPQYVRALKKLFIKEHCKALIAVSNDFTIQDTKEYRKQIKHTVRCMEIARELGGKTTRVLMGSKNSDERKLPKVISGFSELTSVAEKLKMKLAIENHDRLSRNPSIMMHVLRQLESAWFGICLDFGNLELQTRYQSLRRLAPKTLMLHAKGYDFMPNGEETTISFRKCFHILHQAKFRGPIVIEYDNNGDQIIGSMKTKMLVERYAESRWIF